jgi:hypothetical protein
MRQGHAGGERGFTRNFDCAGVGGALNQHPGGGVARLARVVEALAHTAFDGIGVGVGKDQVGALAAQFQRHFLEAVGGGFGDGDTGAGGAGEGNHCHIGVG